MPALSVRPTLESDVPVLKQVLDATGLFPSDMLQDMVTPFLNGSTEALWLTAESDGTPCGFCFAQPEQLTEGTWNMLAIAVAPAQQGAGVGTGLTGALEQHLRDLDARILIADTSGTDDFTQTRDFYAKNGYAAEARIRDFWAAGDDKVTFRKAL